MADLGKTLELNPRDIKRINDLLMDPDNPQVRALCKLVDEFGGVAAINEKAKAAGAPEALMNQLEQMNSPYVKDIEWLMEQRDKGAFVSMADYSRAVMGEKADLSRVNMKNAVTLEISALQFFPWVIAQAQSALAKRELMPGRFIRVRNMAEQSQDQGDILATALAMKVMGASWVESLDTRGTDGSNIHLAGGPETLTGFFGGIGQPNTHPVRWAREYLNYYTTYGIRQVLNINSGTVLLGCMLHRMGVDMEFKISVFVGNDNPYFILWTLMMAKLFSRPDGSTPLAGLNLSNSVDNETIRHAGYLRRRLGLETRVRFEHHITETCKSIVQQPYNRRDELVEIAKEVPNISAKHEGGEFEIEAKRDHPSDILDYFMPKAEILEKGLMAAMTTNYLDKHHSVNLTAQALLRSGTGVIAAPNLHGA